LFADAGGFSDGKPPNNREKAGLRKGANAAGGWTDHRVSRYDRFAGCSSRVGAALGGAGAARGRWLRIKFAAVGWGNPEAEAEGKCVTGTTERTTNGGPLGCWNRCY